MMLESVVIVYSNKFFFIKQVNFLSNCTGIRMMMR